MAARHGAASLGPQGSTMGRSRRRRVGAALLMKGPDNLFLPPSLSLSLPFPLPPPSTSHFSSHLLTAPPHPIPHTLCPGAPFANTCSIFWLGVQQWWWWRWGCTWCVCRGEIQHTKKPLETKSGTSAKAIAR